MGQLLNLQERRGLSGLKTTNRRIKVVFQRFWDPRVGYTNQIRYLIDVYDFWSINFIYFFPVPNDLQIIFK